MGGDELAYPTVNFRPAFDLARQDGLRIVCHAGEIGGPDSVREAIELLGAERIGHGIAVMRDPALAATLATRRVILEICPTSNLCTGALARQTEKLDASLRDHPLPDFIKRGISRYPFDGRSRDVPYRPAHRIFQCRIAGRVNSPTRQAHGTELSRRVSAAG